MRAKHSPLIHEKKLAKLWRTTDSLQFFQMWTPDSHSAVLAHIFDFKQVFCAHGLTEICTLS